MNKIKITVYSKDNCFACEHLLNRLNLILKDEELIIVKDERTEV